MTSADSWTLHINHAAMLLLCLSDRLAFLGQSGYKSLLLASTPNTWSADNAMGLPTYNTAPFIIKHNVLHHKKRSRHFYSPFHWDKRKKVPVFLQTSSVAVACSSPSATALPCSLTDLWLCLTSGIASMDAPRGGIQLWGSSLLCSPAHRATRGWPLHESAPGHPFTSNGRNNSCFPQGSHRTLVSMQDYISLVACPFPGWATLSSFAFLGLFSASAIMNIWRIVSQLPLMLVCELMP